jgi:hypothetical protein
VSGYNGHANSVKGGAGGGTGAESTARNIFNARGGAAARNTSHNPLMHFQGSGNPGDSSTGLRGPTGDGSLGYQPNHGTRGKYNKDEWGVDEYATQTNNNFHQFMCSKCHGPHAARLPKLMITNCLDTKHNWWDNRYGLMTTTNSFNTNRPLSQWTSAQNCHRLVGLDPSDTRADVSGLSGGGWNKVTPW